MLLASRCKQSDDTSDDCGIASLTKLSLKAWRAILKDAPQVEAAIRVSAAEWVSDFSLNTTT